MKKKNILLFLLFLAGTMTSLWAQPNLTLWHVDEAHLQDHTKGLFYEVFCGNTDGVYLFYEGSGLTEEVIIDLKNEGDQPIVLNLPLQLAGGSAAAFEITQQPGKSTLQPGEEAQLRVLYTSPATYQNSKASIAIESNDPDGDCVLYLEVGGGPSEPPVNDQDRPCEECDFEGSGELMFGDQMDEDSSGDMITTVIEVDVDQNLTASGDVCVSFMIKSDLNSINERIEIQDEGNNSLGLTNNAKQCGMDDGPFSSEQGEFSMTTFSLSASAYNTYAQDGKLRFTLLENSAINDLESCNGEHPVKICVDLPGLGTIKDLPVFSAQKKMLFLSLMLFAGAFFLMRGKIFS